MVAKSQYRGHEIIYDEEINHWRFVSDDEELHDKIVGNYIDVKCKHCEYYILPNNPDHCLGHLEGVIAACCGHNQKRGYIVFKDGKKITFENVRVEIDE